jgi:hypothetical protein
MMRSQLLYEDSIAIREWLSRSPQSFRIWLQDLRESEVKQVSTADEPRYIHRSQGRLEIINRILGLSDELLEKGRS